MHRLGLCAARVLRLQPAGRLMPVLFVDWLELFGPSVLFIGALIWFGRNRGRE